MTSFSFSKGLELEVTIESLISTGNGIARYQGMVIFVAASSPGDRCRVRLTSCKKNFCEAEIIELIEPSPFRREPRCPVYEQCGGCSWQHIDYAEQVRQKRKIVADALERVGQIEPPDFECVPSPKEYRYRNRIQMHYVKESVGFHGKKSNRIVDTDDCLIAQEELIPLFQELRNRNAERPERAELRLHQGQARIFASEKEVGFAQANDEQNENIKSYVFELIRERTATCILDLYCGSGNFTFELAKQFPTAKVVGVDINENSIRAAQKQNTNDKVQFHCADSSLFLKNYANKVDLVLIDPPRTGCDEKLIESLRSSKAEALIYISCNPSTWARDLKPLDWSLESLRAFDMFPQTPHVEVVSLLKNKNAAQ